LTDDILACNLDEGRSFDPDTNEWVYVVFCCNPDHKDRDDCKGWEMFRKHRETGIVR
jgi:hypothetical protein